MHKSPFSRSFKALNLIWVFMALACLVGSSHPALAVPSLSVNDVSVNEGNSGTIVATFLVTLSAPSSVPVTFHYVTADVTATAGADYVALASAPLTIAAGKTVKAVNVTVKGDVIDEVNETFSVKISDPVGATIADGTGIGTIVDDDSSVLSLTGSSVTEGNDGTRPMNFTLALSTPNSRVVSVQVKNIVAATAPATVATDYAPFTTTTLSFAPGETSKTFSVSIKGDKVDEDDEHVAFSLEKVVNATVGTMGQGTIVDDDGTPVLSVKNVSVTEGNANNVNAGFTVTLSNPSSRTVTVQYATADGTAKANDDYVALPLTTLTFAPGQTSRAVNVVVKGDEIDEVNETFTFNLSAPTNATIGSGTAVGTIVDNDTSILTYAGSGVIEGDSGTKPMLFTFTLSHPNSRTVTVKAKTGDAPIATATANEDYVPYPSTTLSFAPGETTKTLTVTIKGDELYEENERVAFVLTNLVNASMSTGVSVPGTITNDDPQPLFSIEEKSITLNEGDFNNTTVTIHVSISVPSSRPIMVDYATDDGSASGNSDYQSKSGTLVFQPGETSKTVEVIVQGDIKVEDDENFFVDFFHFTGVGVEGDNFSSTITILNDDSAPTVKSGNSF